MPSDKEARDAAYIRLLEDMVEDLRRKLETEVRQRKHLTLMVLRAFDIVHTVADAKTVYDGHGGVLVTERDPDELVEAARRHIEAAKQPG